MMMMMNDDDDDDDDDDDVMPAGMQFRFCSDFCFFPDNIFFKSHFFWSRI